MQFFGKIVRTFRMKSVVVIGTILTLGGISLFVAAKNGYLAQFIQKSGPEASTAQNQDEKKSSEKNADQRGDLLVQYAANVMEGYSSVEANMRQRINILGQDDLMGSGVYLEQWTDQRTRFDFDRYRFRWQVSIQSEFDAEPDLCIKVRDQRYVWTYRQIGTKANSPDGKTKMQKTLQRVDIVKVAQALEEVGEVPSIKLLNSWPELGGLASMLHVLHESFEFQCPELVQINNNEKVWRVVGTWRPDSIRQFVPQVGDGENVDLSKLPPQIPSHVVVYFGQDDYFPYRLQYLRKNDEALLDTDAPKWSELLAIEFYDVTLNQPIPDIRFQFTPGDTQPLDVTEPFMAQLGVPSSAYR